jgi:pimeloyl-ACP methyl ester carboxylesterase
VPAHHIAAHDAFVQFLDLPGAEPPIVWMHGLGQSSRSLVPIATHERLRGRRSLLIDFLGFGYSDKPGSFGYSLVEHAEVVIAVLDAVGISRCSLVGHSLGGAVAVEIAARRPELVSALVAAEANLDPGGGELSRAIAGQTEEEYVSRGYERDVAAFRAAARTRPDAFSRAMLGMIQVASPIALYRTSRALVELLAPTIHELLLGLEVPRSFLVGELTRRSGVKLPSGEDGEGLEGSDVGVIAVADAGHQMMFDNPDGFAAAIADALS